MTIIGLKELKQNASQIAERAQKGKRFTVVKRSKAVFDIVPSSQSNANLEATKAWSKDFAAKHWPIFDALAKK